CAATSSWSAARSATPRRSRPPATISARCSATGGASEASHEARKEDDLRTVGPRLGGEPVDVATLPTTVPAFPLVRPLLLPGTVVPLAAAPPADRWLLEDVLAAPGDAHGYIAALQPREEPGEGADEAEPALYSVGRLAYLGEG